MAADRLLGNVALQLALPSLYAVLARFLLRGIRRPVIVVDWTGGGVGVLHRDRGALLPWAGAHALRWSPWSKEERFWLATIGSGGGTSSLAGTKPKDLGIRGVYRHETRPHRVVLSARRKLKGRHRLSTLGTRRQRTADRQRSEAAREPLVLVASLDDRAADVAAAAHLGAEETPSSAAD